MLEGKGVMTSLFNHRRAIPAIMCAALAKRDVKPCAIGSCEAGDFRGS